MKKEFSAEELTSLRLLIEHMNAESPDEQDSWKRRALITVAMLRETFPAIGDDMLAGFCGAITYLIGEISAARVADVGRMINVVFMSYTLATAHLLGVYDAGDVSKVTMPEPESEEYFGQYL